MRILYAHDKAIALCEVDTEEQKGDDTRHWIRFQYTHR